MKPLKTLMFIAAAVIAFASCTSDDTVVEDNSSAVPFQGANLKLTVKAGPDVLTNFSDGFYV